METLELIEYARRCNDENFACQRCPYYEADCVDCREGLIRDLADRLKKAYEDIQTWGETGTFCLGCSHLKDTTNDCRNNCKWQWRGETE